MQGPQHFGYSKRPRAESESPLHRRGAPAHDEGLSGELADGRPRRRAGLSDMDLTYYEILGVENDADDARLKQAFKELAIKFHPDKNPGNILAEERFKAVASAYAVLSDRKKRFMYDIYGKQAVENSMQSKHMLIDEARRIFESLFPPSGSEFSQQQQQQQQLHWATPIARQPFGAGPAAVSVGSARAGDTLTQGVSVVPSQLPGIDALAGAITGGLREGRNFIVKEYECTIEELYARATKVFRVTRTKPGAPSPPSAGSGASGGNDQDSQRQFLKVRLQPWWRDGYAIVYDDGAPDGVAIKFVMRVAQHNHFSLRGNDIVCNIKISLADAVLGVEVHVPTVDGNIATLRRPGVISPGLTHTFEGEGMPVEPSTLDNAGGDGDQAAEKRRRARGDLVVVFDVVFPDKIALADDDSRRMLHDALSGRIKTLVRR